MADEYYTVPTLNGIEKKLNNIATIGDTALCGPINQGNSASRLHMATVQKQQRLSMVATELAHILHGGEYEVGKYTFDAIMPCSAYVFDSVVHSHGFASASHDTPRTIIYQEDESGIYDYIEVDNYVFNHTKFGYEKRFDPIVHSLAPGSVLHKGQRLTRTSNIMEGDLHSDTINCWTLYVTDFATTEDGFRFSESFIEKTRPTALGDITGALGSSQFPLWLYNTESETQKQIMPNIGEKIRDDGMVVALREYSEMWDWMFCHEDLMDKPDPMFDQCLYGEPGAEVVEIDSLTNSLDDKKHFTNPELTKVLKQQVNKKFGYSRRMIEAYTRIKTTDRNAKISTRLMRKFAEAFNVDPNNKELISLLPKNEQVRLKNISERNSTKKPKFIDRTKKNAPLDEYTFRIRYKWLYEVGKGAKYADNHGGKGVICEETPDDQMFYNARGIIADRTVYPGATVSRMNLDQLTEHYINAFMWYVSLDCAELMEQGKYEEAFKHLTGAYKITSPFITYPDVMEMCKTMKRKIQHLEATCGEGKWPRITVHADSTHLGHEIIGRIIEYREPTEETIYFTNYKGEKEELLQKGIIAPMCLAILEKTAHNAIASATARTQHHGLPTSSTQKHSMPGQLKERSPKKLSETEVWTMSNVIGAHNVAMLKQMATDRRAAESSAELLYQTERPLELEDIIDRSRIPMGEGNELALFEHQLAVLGTGFVGNTPDELDKALQWRQQNAR